MTGARATWSCSTRTSPSSSYLVSDHAYALVGLNSSSSQPFLIYNRGGLTSSGWVPGFSGTTYGLFNASTGFVQSNFTEQDIDTEESRDDNLTDTVEVPDEPILLDQGDATTNEPQHPTKRILVGAPMPSVSSTLA